MRFYTIEKTHRIIKYKDGRTVFGNKFQTAHRWDLPNINIYSEDGELLKEESSGKYDFEFTWKLKHLKDFEIKPFLDYQFEHTENKSVFLKHIKPQTIYSHSFNDKPAKREIIKEWIEEREKTLFKDFEELFNYSYSVGLHFSETVSANSVAKENERNLANLLFNLWLNKKFKYEAGDENYREYLTIDNYKQFLKSYIKEMKDKKSEWGRIVKENRKEIGLVKEKETDKREIAPLVKIKWDGQKNQLYDVIRQLKERENKILNSYTDLAVFLKTNFEMFDNTSLSTIETELQRGKRPPKRRRINLDTQTQPE